MGLGTVSAGVQMQGCKGMMDMSGHSLQHNGYHKYLNTAVKKKMNRSWSNACEKRL